MPSPILKKLPGETDLRFICRLGTAKDDGLLDMTWTELADVFNKELGVKYGESVFRKRFALLKEFMEEFGSDVTESVDAAELRQLKDDIQKEKRKLFDQRREYNKLLASDARSEHLTECMIEAANALNEKYPLIEKGGFPFTKDGKQAVICFADWHYGMTTNNIWNTFNTEICRRRVEKCVEYMCKYIKEHNVKIARVCLLGDFCAGAIHSTCRVQAEEDTCDQIMNVAEILAQAIHNISQCVDFVYVYTNYGNHLRTVQKKEESIYTDNMEKIIPWWLEQRLKQNKKIIIAYSAHREFTCFDVFKYTICCVHGDIFNFRDIGITANTVFSKKFGYNIDYTISGDKHHLEEFAQYGIESILVRSLCGTDDYAANKHLYDKPGQTMIIFNKEYGRECTYHIPLE